MSELPNLLALLGAPGSETNLFGWAASGYVEGAGAAAAHTLLPAAVNDARDDVSSPASLAYANERRAAECLDGVLAILALTASQALYVSKRSPAPPLEEFLAGVRSIFPPLDRQRKQLGSQAGRLAEVLSACALTGRLDFGFAQAGPVSERAGAW